MLHRLAAIAACVLALDFSLSQDPVLRLSNANVIAAATAARPASTELFTLRVKHDLADAETPAIPSATTETPKNESRYVEPDSSGPETLAERAGQKAKDAIHAVQELAASLTKEEPPMDPGLDMRPAPIVWPKLTREETCNAIELAALEHNLPAEFLSRLIWQESGHNAKAVSPAGARGIAQFMPGTAADIGLRDPFDAVQSLLKSAKFLRKLHDKFGNVGLAAAAYNGGPGRLERWLETRVKNKKAVLPQETQNYVRIITGKPVTEWVGINGVKAVELKQTKTVPCVTAPVIEAKTLELPKHQKVASLDGKIADVKSVSSEAAEWNVQVIGAWSEQKAHEQFAALKKKYPSMLGARRPSVFRSKLAKGGQATFIRIAASTQAEGHDLCSKLKETGGSCAVTKNTIKTASKS